MSAEPYTPTRSIGRLPEGDDAIRRNVSARQRYGRIWQSILLASTLVGIVILLLLAWNIVNDAFGGVAIQTSVDPVELTGGRELTQLSNEELVVLLNENLRSRVLRNLEREKPLAERTTEELQQIVNEEVVQPEVVALYPLREWLFNRGAIEAEVAEEFPRAELEFRSWLTPSFITTPMASNAAVAGIRTAILGSIWLLFLTVLIAFPLGIGAAIFLEEYQGAKPFDERQAFGRRLNAIYQRVTGIIQVNIYNLSGVPSIIYGMLGLAIFVRTMGVFTSGAAFGLSPDSTSNGRTILSAALTMALLVLPVVIISSQEAIRAVPSSLRQASFGLGATKWQTIWKIVLPNALPGILTGTILAISRAIGETAPLIVVGASTFIVTDPNGIFSKFTVLPIQIYNWTARPQEEFRAIAAAAIIALLIILLSMNAVAIFLRNYLRSKRIS